MKLLSSIPRPALIAKIVATGSLAGLLGARGGNGSGSQNSPNPPAAQNVINIFAGVVGTVAGIPGQSNLVTGSLPAPLPDIGALLWFGQSLCASDLDDNIILSISPLQ